MGYGGTILIPRSPHGKPKKLVRLIKVCLKEIYSKVLIGKNLPDAFPIQNGPKQGDALWLLLYNFALEYIIRNIQENQEGMELNGTHQLLFYADDVNVMDEHIKTGRRNTEAVLEPRSREVGLNMWSCVVTRMQKRIAVY
jgi:hypothetical protein